MAPSTDGNSLGSTDALADEMGLPIEVATPCLITYRSVGVGVFGFVMRWAGMVRMLIREEVNTINANA